VHQQRMERNRGSGASRKDGEKTISGFKSIGLQPDHCIPRARIIFLPGTNECGPPPSCLSLCGFVTNGLLPARNCFVPSTDGCDPGLVQRISMALSSMDCCPAWPMWLRQQCWHCRRLTRAGPLLRSWRQPSTTLKPEP
jgi:hypothetical protein